MKSLFRLRPRRVVAAFAVVGAVWVGAGVVTSSPVSADSHCFSAAVWVYYSDGTPDGHENGTRWTVYEDTCVTEAPWEPNTHPSLVVEQDTPVAGVPGGGGFDAWVIP